MSKYSRTPDAKDQMRIRDIMKNAGGEQIEAEILAERMARKITDVCKAIRRARAADLHAADACSVVERRAASSVARIFYIRYGQLGGAL